jgi:hypothetical protein
MTYYHADFSIHGVTKITAQRRLGKHTNWLTIIAQVGGDEDGDEAEITLFCKGEPPEIELLPDKDKRGTDDD